MTLEQLIEQLRQQQSTQLAQRATHEQAVAAVRAEAGANRLTVAQEDQLRAAADAMAAIDTEVAALTEREAQLRTELEANQRAAALRNQLAGVGGGGGANNGDGPGAGPGLPGIPAQRADGTYVPARTGQEERTYTQEKAARGQASFFMDAYRCQVNRLGNPQARERLERHGREVIVEGEISERATSTGSFGGLIVPQYLVEMAARLMRAGRPLANLVTSLPLPAQGMNLIIPRGTTGAAVASQATQNTALQNTDEVWTDLNVPVVTIGGQQDVSRQSLERGAASIDEIVYLDLAAAYHAEVSRQVAAGSGASGQMLGILQTLGIGTSTAFGAAATGQAAYSKTGGAIASVASTGAGIQPRVIVMHPRRWGWWTTLVDNAGRPFVTPAGAGASNALGLNTNPGAYGGDGHGNPSDTTSVTVVGQLQGLPVVTDASIPTSFGTAAEDPSLVFDPNHALLWEEGDGMPKELRFEQTLGHTLTVKLAVYGYAAFTAARYPGAFARVGGSDSTAGNGFTAPTF